eukprot:SAG31_NODE_30766_length_376_cov_0.938628_1_plen_93_part_10
MDAVLTACTNETLLKIASALPTSVDLLHLAMTCQAAASRLYFTKNSYPFSALAQRGHGAAAAEDTQWSIVEEAARQRLAALSEQEQGWILNCA